MARPRYRRRSIPHLPPLPTQVFNLFPGFDVNAEGMPGWPLLHIAAAYNKVRDCDGRNYFLFMPLLPQTLAVAWLLRHGANAAALNSEQLTADCTTKDDVRGDRVLLPVPISPQPPPPTSPTPSSPPGHPRHDSGPA